MKKLALLLASSMAFATAAATAFVVPPALPSTKQVSICSISAVDIRSAATGIRSYTDLADTQKVYQAGDMITVATTIEVKNLAKFPQLASVDGKDIDLQVTSSTADFSYANVAPVVLSAVIASDMWGSTSNVGTIATRIMSGALKFDRQADQLTLHMVGVEDQGTLEGNLQAYIAKEGLDKSGRASIFIPAINAKDYTTPYGAVTAPNAVQYTLVVTALARPATEGNLQARLMTSGSENFFDASQKLYDKVFEGQKPNSSMRILNVSNKYAVVRFFEDKKNDRIGLSGILEGLGWPLGERADVLEYRGTKGTLELWRIFAHDSGSIDGINLNKFIIGLISEHSEDPTAKTRGIGLCEFNPANEIQRMHIGEYRYGGKGLSDGTVYADNASVKSPTGMSAKDIDNALTHFGLDIGINMGGAPDESVFERVGAKSSYSEPVKGVYRYGTISIVEDKVDEGTNEDIVVEDDLVEEDELVPDEEIEEEIPEDKPVPVPSTGDRSSPLLACILMLTGAAGAAFALKKSLKS